MRVPILLGVLAGAVLIAVQASRIVDAQALTSPTYTAAQSAAGREAYPQGCASCHGQNLDDGEFGPPLKGVEFRQRWGARSAETLFTYMTTRMPPATPGALGDGRYAELLAFILEQNGVAPGTRQLPSDPAALAPMVLPAAPPGAGGGLSAGVVPNGPNEATPLVHDGVMFVHSYGDKVQALDADTGDLLWQYSRRMPKGAPTTVKRAIAVYGDQLFVPTSDTHIVALDVKTGKVNWDQAVGDHTKGYGMTGGPLVAKGKVMVGTTGRAPGGNYIVALEAATGAEAWRFHTIARPNAPGGNSWNGLALDQRNGASVWVPGSYDPALNLAYFGPAQTYDTGPLRNLSDEGRDITNDALYTDATIALNPDTGKLAWYFQHQPNDQWDLDWAFERHLVRLPVNGATKTVVVTGGKQAIFDAMDAETGRYVFSMDLGLQNVVTAIDRTTGAKSIDPRLVPGDGEAKLVCPHAGGAKSWLPSSYNPGTKTLYMVNGRQYVAMVVGNGGAHAATWPQLVPEIQNPPDRGAAIWVFELP